MSLRKYVFLYPLLISIAGLYFLNVALLVFISGWTLILHLASFIIIALSKTINKATERLLITSWSLGWMVTVMFWVYVFPNVDLKMLPPAW